MLYNISNMGILSGQSDFFGLDIGTSSIRVVQLRGGAQRTLLSLRGVGISESAWYLIVFAKSSGLNLSMSTTAEKTLLLGIPTATLLALIPTSLISSLTAIATFC
jgi:hypothetical protein